MNTPDLIQLAADPRFISGIYNYCDRWCERCAFTARCLNFAQLAELEARYGDGVDDLRNEKFWLALQETFAQTREMIVAFAAEQGIDLACSEEEAAVRQAEQRALDEATYAQPLLQRAEWYASHVQDWFKQEAAALQAAMQQADADDLLQDAIAVIQWYQFLPAAKLFRALRRDEVTDEAEDYVRTDRLGSIKVALVALDRSLMAWGRVREYAPALALRVMPLLVELENLRRLIEQQFPDARDFIRPGFDEASGLVM